MIDVFLPIQAFVKINKIHIDNNVFRMHYKLTVIILLVSFVLITSKQLFGEPVLCKGDTSKDINVINTYCWNYGTFTLKSRWKGVQGKHYSYPGVGQESNRKNDIIHHTYYQWVCILFLLQAAMFYFPRYLWKLWEGGRLKGLCADINGPIPPPDWATVRRPQLVTYFSRGNACCHLLYVLRYSFCELLNLINVVSQICLLNIFLGGAFETYGSSVAAFTSHVNTSQPPADLDNVSPMDKYFPKMASCNYYEYGASGDIMTLNYICVLPLNILNEKIFVILWFWLLFLSFASAMSVTFRLLTFCLTPLRMLLIMSQVRFAKQSVTCKIVRRLSFGDWFVLYLLGKNINAFLFRELVMELSEALERKTHLV